MLEEKRRDLDSNPHLVKMLTGPVIFSEPSLPHRVVVKVKWWGKTHVHALMEGGRTGYINN